MLHHVNFGNYYLLFYTLLKKNILSVVNKVNFIKVIIQPHSLDVKYLSFSLSISPKEYFEEKIFLVIFNCF